MSKPFEIRPLTQEEIDNFSGQSSVDVAMESTDGVWYYAESGQNMTANGEVYDETQFVADEDGDYIPVE